jgi:RNA polymerase sigma factor (TIGR02999 family)
VEPLVPNAAPFIVNHLSGRGQTEGSLSNEDVTLVGRIARLMGTFVGLLVPRRRQDSILGLGTPGGVAAAASQHESSPIARLLWAVDHGDTRMVAAAVDAFVPLVGDELRRLVRLKTDCEGDEVIFHPKVLVNEAALRFLGSQERIEHRQYFSALAAGVVRQALVDLARTRLSLDRDDGGPQVAAKKARVSAAWSADLIALDDALIALAARDPRQSQMVELRVFGGLSTEHISNTMTVAPAVVMRNWKQARVELSGELERMNRWSVGSTTRTIVGPLHPAGVRAVE